jgi:hypothetical protein
MNVTEIIDSTFVAKKLNPIDKKSNNPLIREAAGEGWKWIAQFAHPNSGAYSRVAFGVGETKQHAMRNLIDQISKLVSNDVISYITRDANKINTIKFNEVNDDN